MFNLKRSLVSLVDKDFRLSMEAKKISTKKNSLALIFYC